MIYFDHNATSPMCAEARRAWLEATDQLIGNPSSPHRIGSRADHALSEARSSLASHLGCDPLDIVWTSGATEANNMALHHFSALRQNREIWVSSIEHPSVLEPARHYFPRKVQFIPALRSGVADLEWIRNRIKSSGPELVALLSANNETGVLQPWSEVLALCREYGVPFLCDATQWIGKHPSAGLGGCDFVSGSAHKFGGPKGVGFLKCPAKGAVTPFLHGGKQEEGRRAGTENVAGVIAFAAALAVREAAMAEGGTETRFQWRERFEDQLIEELPGSQIVGLGQNRLWNTVSALMPESDCRQRWVVKLDKLGFAVSTGSACASGREEPSHVIAAMGFSPAEAGRVLRFSSGWETSQSDWTALLHALKTVSEQTRSESKNEIAGQ
ncbi:MAG: cysteine desulfurase family protein [Verrucomicrobia bacterium]|nr:cysteine desulfurase family protein [Verrucomicrobiota bacterium]